METVPESSYLDNRRGMGLAPSMRGCGGVALAGTATTTDHLVEGEAVRTHSPCLPCRGQSLRVIGTHMDKTLRAAPHHPPGREDSPYRPVLDWPG